jgi:hypothetical protein
MTMVQISFFVGLSIIGLRMAFDEGARLMSIMVMASHGRQVTVCVGRDFKMSQKSALARHNSSDINLLEWYVRLPLRSTVFHPSLYRVISLAIVFEEVLAQLSIREHKF